MLRFYHIGGASKRSTQRAERVNSHSPQESRPKDATASRVKHPGRHFQRSRLWVVANATGKHDRATPVPFSMDRYLTSIERMPCVNHLCRIGFMGFVSLGCTTEFAHTARSVTKRQTNLLRSSLSNNRNNL